MSRVTRYICVAMALCAATPALPQSFDCKKASRPMEHAICDDKAVADMDVELSAKYREALASHAASRRELISSERRWISLRDAQCLPYINDFAKLDDCLRPAYGARLRAIASGDFRSDIRPPESAAVVAARRTTVCRKIVERYRPLAHSHPGQPPLDVLASNSASGITMGSKGVAQYVDSASQLASWATHQKPPFSLSPDLAEQVRVFGDGGMLVKAPGVDFYSVSRVEGSMNCQDGFYFFVKNGVAALADAPFPDSDGGCNTGEIFGTVDGAPVTVQQEYDYRPGMSAKIEVATWDDDHFQASCEIELFFVPRLSAKTLNDWGETCHGKECPALRAAAFALVRKALKNPAALRDVVRHLSAKQRAEYEQAQSVVGNSTEFGPSEAVLLVPYQLAGRVYVARIADFTIGWRDFADQSVMFLNVEDGKIVQKAAFAVGVWKGDLRDVSVNVIN
jgi:uncharacterized protein